LGLKPGARNFSKEKISDLILLIQKKRIEDVEILALAKPDSEKVQEVAKARIAQFKKKIYLERRCRSLIFFG
jgi:hypothetical protein